jgi:DNA-binding response OmpR family regulator
MPQKRILIVEDHTDLRRMFRTALSLAGYEVDEASDGLEALRKVEAYPPDLVVLDLMLQTLDGISVQQELASRAITSQIPIVIVTGSTLEVEAVNVACLLRKPVTSDELIRTVETCLRHGSPAAGA